jgi:glycosyl transferase, family 25
MHAYVINLARSRDRRTYITAHLHKIGADYEIVTAIDGRDLDLDDSRIIAPSYRTTINLPVGSAGAALSHLAVYRRIIDDGLDMALVLEDDIILPADLNALADAVGKELVGAEIALLSVDTPTPLKMSTEGSLPLSSSRFLALPINASQPLSGAAYVITREACERMVERNFPIRTVADAWGFYYREGILDRVRCVVPIPVRKNPNLSSTMGSYSLGTSAFGRLIAVLMQYRIPVLQQVMAYRRMRIYRQIRLSEFTDGPFVEKPSRLDLSDALRVCTSSPTVDRLESSLRRISVARRWFIPRRSE